MGVKKIFLNVFAVITVAVFSFSLIQKNVEAESVGVGVDMTVSEITASSAKIKVVVNRAFAVKAFGGESVISFGIKAKNSGGEYANFFPTISLNGGYEPKDIFIRGDNDYISYFYIPPYEIEIKLSGLTSNTTYEILPTWKDWSEYDEDYVVPTPFKFKTLEGTSGSGLKFETISAISGPTMAFREYEYNSSLYDVSDPTKLEIVDEVSFDEKFANINFQVTLNGRTGKDKEGAIEGDSSTSYVSCKDVTEDGGQTYHVCNDGYTDDAFPIIIYDADGNKVSTTYVHFDSNKAPKNLKSTIASVSLEKNKSYTAKLYYKSVYWADSYPNSEKLEGETLYNHYKIAETSFISSEELVSVESGTSGDNTAQTDYDDDNWLDIKCKAHPSSWDGCMVLWFRSLVYTPAQGILYIGALFTDSMLSFSISSVIYKNATFAETGWQIIRDLSNLFFIIILVYVAIGTILGNQKGSIQKIITQLIVVALLINFSLFFTRIIVDSSNILARVFYNTLTIEGKGETPVVKNTGVEYKSLSRSIVQGLNVEKTINRDVFGGDANENLGSVFVMLLFGVFLCLYAAWEFFLIGFMFLQRIMEIWISMIFAPLAFVSRIVPGWGGKFDRAGWDRWIKNLLCWCFIAPIFLFFVMLIGAFINSNFLSGLIVAKAEGGLNIWQYWVAILLQFMIIIGLLKMVRGIAKTLGCESANQFVDIGAKWGKKVGFGAGALALGVASGGAAAIGRNTLGRMGTNVAQSESLKMKSKQSGMSGWIARQQLNTANKLSKSTFDVRKTAAGSGLKNLGFKEAGLVGKATSALGFNENQSDGYKERTEKRKKKEVDFYKELKVDKAGHDKMKEKYGSGLEDFIKNNSAKYGYTGGKISEFKKANSAKFKEAKEKFDSLRDEQMYGKYYERYKKKNDLTYLTDTQKKEALKTVRKDKLETTKGVFEKKNGTDRNLEDINQDRLNAYAEVIDRKTAHIAGAGVKSAGNVGVGGAVVNAAGGLSLAGAGTIGAFAGIPLLEASAKSDAYKQAAEELRDMAKAEGKSKGKRESSERDISKKIEKEEKYQEKVKEKLLAWEKSAEEHDRTAREEMKIKAGKLNIDDPELDGKLEKLMEMNDRKIAEHQLKRDSLSEKTKDLIKKGKSLPEKEHEDFVKAVTEIKKLEKENKDMEGLTENFKKSTERLDNFNEKKGNIGKSTGGDKKEEPKKEEGKK